LGCSRAWGKRETGEKGTKRKMKKHEGMIHTVFSFNSTPSTVYSRALSYDKIKGGIKVKMSSSGKPPVTGSDPTGVIFSAPLYGRSSDEW
jgi:hypothetical protein